MASFTKERSVIHQCKPLDFFEFIFERQSVYHRRFVLKQPPPWTNDPILSTFKFTNAYRELDRVTLYLINRVIENASLSIKQRVFAILIFRIFNRDQFFDRYLSCVPSVELFEATVWIKELDAAKASGLKLFNDAYNITQRTYCSEYRKGEKHVQHLLNAEAIAKNWDDTFSRIEGAATAKEIHGIIEGLTFFGSFLAGQCLTDISYIKGFKSEVDFDAWYPVGPGAEGGLDSYSACVVSDYEVACKSVWGAQEGMFRELYEKTGKDWFTVKYDTPYRDGPYLSLNNAQACFCEFRKFLSLKQGNGRKRYYKSQEA